MGTDVPGIAQPDGHLGNGGDPDRDERARLLKERMRELADTYRGLPQRVAQLEAERLRLHQRVDDLKAESPQVDSDIAEIQAGYAKIRAGHAEVDKELKELDALLAQLEQKQAELTAAGTAETQGTPQQREDEPSPKRVPTGILALVAGAANLFNANARHIPYAPARLAAFIVCWAATCVVVVVLLRRWNAARRTKDRSDNHPVGSG